MNKTKIEYCDRTWNPVTGCLHGCPYCYARKIAKRFEGADKHISTLHSGTEECKLYELRYPAKTKGRNAPYPFEFAPTFHRYRLDEPQSIKKPKNIFVCSMADLFGDWVPDKWIQEVFKACEKAPQHRYLFLTKNTMRYLTLAEPKPNYWYGSTVVNSEVPFFYSNRHNVFTSIEPIQSNFERGFPILESNWVIVGLETGNRKGKVIPKREWIENIVDRCRKNNVPVFLKNNLAEIWGEPLIQEFPWGVKEASIESNT